MKRASELRLPRERVLEAATLVEPEVRLAVSNYYAAQAMRKRIDMQVRHLGDKEPPAILGYAGDAFSVVEGQVQRMLLAAAEASPAGRWLLRQYGVGPVIAAGLLAHVDVRQAPTVGHVWRYAGLDPTRKWEKGQKRPWCAELKQVCWHAGECFKRTSGSPESYYGALYRQRKEYEVRRNEAGGNAARAETFFLAPGATEKSKAALAAGKLPDFQLDRQATRWTVKMLLSHFHVVLHWTQLGGLPPAPFSIAALGHAHYVPVPHPEVVPGLAEALAEQSERAENLERTAWPERAGGYERTVV